jgi:hypothetical protein
LSIEVMGSQGLDRRRTNILFSEYVELTRIPVIDSASYVGNSRKEDGSYAKCREQGSDKAGRNTGVYSHTHVYNSLYIEVHTYERKLQ